MQSKRSIKKAAPHSFPPFWRRTHCPRGQRRREWTMQATRSICWSSAFQYCNPRALPYSWTALLSGTISNWTHLQHLIDASAQSGLPLKIHVNQFYDIGGIEMAVAAQALSVDHLEVMTPEAMKSLHGSNTIATLLPSCSYFLGIPYGPARELIENDTIVALATDYNPGSSRQEEICNSFVIWPVPK